MVSDIHLGPALGRGFAQRVADTINSAQPDLTAVGGELVDGSVKDWGPAAAPPAQLRARHGSYFVAGNHEQLSGARLHASRGAGAWGPPTRGGAPSDVTVVELASKRA